MRNSLTAKVSIFYFATFVFTIVLAMAQEVMAIDYNYIVLPQWGPGIAALIFGFTLYKKSLNKSVRLSVIHPVKLIICLLLPFGMIGVGYFISSILGLASGFGMDIKMLYFVIPASLLGALGEALGWRCFLQSALDDKLSYLTASVVTGVLWGLWHVGHFSNGVIYMGLFLIFTISFSVILAYLIRESDYNLILAAILHFSANIGFFMFYSENLSDINMMLINAVVWLAGAVLVAGPTLRGSRLTRKVHS